MQWLSALFVFAVVAGVGLELWLSARQAAAVALHRERVPGPFVASISALRAQSRTVAPRLYNLDHGQQERR